MNNDPWANFLTWEQASRDTIDFKTIYVDMADDLVSGLLLSQIVYWYLPSKKGQSKLRVFKDGYYWIAKARHEWWDEIRVKTRQIDRAITILEEKGIIFSHLYRFNNAPTTHIRIIKEGFLAAWDSALARFDETVKSEVDPFSPNRQMDLTKRSNGFDETVKSDLPESVQSLTETTIDLTETTAENTSPIGEKPDPLSFSLARKTANSKESNYAIPPSAGGADVLADSLIAIYCQRLGEALPRGGEIISCRAAVNKVLKAKGLQQDGQIAKRGIEILLDPDGEYGWYHAKYTLSVGNKLFIQHYGKVLGRLIAGGDGYSKEHKKGKPTHATRQHIAPHAVERKTYTAEEGARIQRILYGDDVPNV